ncbi:bifunctional protein-serine/threonine kinase/phosphatase [Hydrogenophaga sp. H7]|uniref:bifunctional protein-serine/threonine kinase/phosphatase n=1 Tax=Hydrogenophaga sp. H7 TaxID=1882399 RepID=UPI0009A3CDC5|nr:bifunctional protein-serine/threonine kinase/phosphatase [Hydrogenophaga sp. H7]OPF64277.1 serine/threonine protein phosphatase [Hydrogenophaga sp. H7]
MAFDIDIGYASQAGRKDTNEDFCAAMLPPPGQADMGSIVAIADGVSAGGLGKEAAQTTVTSLVRDYYGTPETWDTTVAMDRIIGAQNTWLAGVNRRRHPAMGLTTLTAMVLRGHSYTLAHVGDTRACLMRGGQLTQLTHDHVADHPDLSHQLLRCIGVEDRVVVDYSQGDLLVGDLFLLMSDGVYNVLNEARLKALIGEQPGTDDAQALCEAMVAAALQRGSNDNVTALAVRVRGLDSATLQDQNRLAARLPIPPRLKLGEQIDGLAITAVVADNGINLVYQARDPATQKLYALKTLHPQRAHDAEERAMLAHEAWLARRMATSRAAEHLVALHDAPPTLPAGQGASAFYLLYDWHSGESLQHMLDRQHRPGVAQTIATATQAARALGHLHRQGVIHRDVKPANLHQGEDGVLRLLDLGVALSGREPASARALHAGTPSFINPEQWGFRLRGGGVDTDAEPQAADPRSDLFALGVTLYQLLTGKLPYGEVLPYQAGRYFRDPVAPSRHHPEVPIWLDHIVLKAVSRDQKQRFETAEELLLALERGASRPLTAPPATPLIQRDPTMLWKLLLGFSVLLNLLLVYWLVFLPR